jgi:hypothetical protein
VAHVRRAAPIPAINEPRPRPSFDAIAEAMGQDGVVNRSLTAVLLGQREVLVVGLQSLQSAVTGSK